MVLERSTCMLKHLFTNFASLEGKSRKYKRIWKNYEVTNNVRQTVFIGQKPINTIITFKST